MLYESANARQYELREEARRMAGHVAIREARKLERMQKRVRLIGARLGLAPVTAS